MPVTRPVARRRTGRTLLRRGWPVLAVVASVVGPVPHEGSSQAAPLRPAARPAGAYVPLEPQRVADTRSGARVAAGTAFTVELTGAGVPDGALAAAVNLTMTDTVGSGFAVVYGADQARPPSSTVNVAAASETAANLTLVGLGARAVVQVFTSVDAHFAIDVVGYFATTPEASAGRYRPVNPARALDTRFGGGGAEPMTVPVELAGRFGLPATGAAAVAVTLTAVDAAGPGWIQAAPSSTAERGLGGFSNLNVARVGQTVANLAIVRLDADGRIVLHSTAAAHLLVDVVGWFTDASAPLTGDKLIDDPVVDQAVLGCAPAAGVKRVLYWTGDINQPDGWNCAEGDWTCEGGSTIGIARYEAALGVSRTPSVWTTHRPYDNPPELTTWW